MDRPGRLGLLVPLDPLDLKDPWVRLDRKAQLVPQDLLARQGRLAPPGRKALPDRLGRKVPPVRLDPLGR